MWEMGRSPEQTRNITFKNERARGILKDKTQMNFAANYNKSNLTQNCFA